jgi:FdhD protein
MKTTREAIALVSGAAIREGHDLLAVEAPLEIRVREHGREERALSLTMRTPGEDAELAAGFLFTEGLVRRREDITELTSPGDDVVVVRLAAGVELPAAGAGRGFAMTSACGVCGKSGLAELRARPAARPSPGAPLLPAALVAALPDRLREAQPAFAATGGLHAAGLFDARGALLLAREDVGRHNAVDKLVGARLLAGALPAAAEVLVVSGRASFELVQKAAMAGIPVLAAVGAPSSLAASLASEYGLTLLGFVREGRFNIYAGRERIRPAHG